MTDNLIDAKWNKDKGYFYVEKGDCTYPIGFRLGKKELYRDQSVYHLEVFIGQNTSSNVKLIRGTDNNNPESTPKQVLIPVVNLGGVDYILDIWQGNSNGFSDRELIFFPTKETIYITTQNGIEEKKVTHDFSIINMDSYGDDGTFQVKLPECLDSNGCLNSCCSVVVESIGKLKET